MPRRLDQLHHDAIAIFRAAVDGVEPHRALTGALAATPRPERVRIIALGKAADAMASAAVQHLDRLSIPVLGGLVVAPDDGASPDPRLRRVTGDHPTPGSQSAAAAEALAEAVARVEPGDEVWALVSGGTTSLIGAPVPGISAAEYLELVQALGRAGLPIGDLNRARKRFSRWGAGRLAVALQHARVRVFALSDVPGDDPADIGSGPLAPDPSTAPDVLALLGTIPAGIPEFAISALRNSEGQAGQETPKPGDAAFATVTTQIIGSNAIARARAAESARHLGYDVVESADLLMGEAADVGRRLGGSALGARHSALGIAHIWGGETTVTLGPGHGLGGRCQELVLAAAEVLGQVAHPIVFLAAGTDGRDGPTDAAGGIVDGLTWRRIEAAGIDPKRALAEHDAHPALAAGGGLLRVGLTGTNVMDIVIALTTGGESEDEAPLGEPIVGA